MTLPFEAGASWSQEAMDETMLALEDIALNDLGLSIYPNNVVIVNEQTMLDAYAGNGMPFMYPHWSFGMEFKRLEARRKNGMMGLALEMVIPSNPCISWNIAENSMAAMTTVMAHAAFGHNHVFRNNHVFKRWVNAEGLAEYCEFARNTIIGFEREFGIEEVERTLDAAHAIQIPGGIFRHGEPPKFDPKEERKRHADRMRALEASFDPEMLASVPGLGDRLNAQKDIRVDEVELPQENILYFIERYGQKLKPWQREILRIVRNMAQMSYAMIQTKVLNEGAAMFVENYLCKKLYEQGRISDGSMLEFIALNQGVLYQTDLRRTGKIRAGFNPYALGYAICMEIVRICGPTGDDATFFEGWIDTTGPTEEDLRWFPSWAGTGDWRSVLKDAWANYRDESFIRQFMSPRLIREWKIFVMTDEGPHYRVNHIHDDDGYEAVISAVARAHTFDENFPDVHVVEAKLRDDRVLKIEYQMRNGMRLNEKDRDLVVEHIEHLWGYDVLLNTK